MKHSLLILLTIFVTSHNAFAQTNFKLTLFESGFRYYNPRVSQAPDSGFFVSGVRQLTAGVNSDNYVLRINNIGDTLWLKVYDDSLVNFTSSQKIITTSNGNSCFVSSKKNLSGTISSGTVTKIDSLGNVLWSRNISAVNGGSTNAFDIADLGNGDVLIAGYTNAFSGSTCALLTKINMFGDTLWVRAYCDFQFQVSGTSSVFDKSIIKVTFDGGILIAGNTGSSNNADLYIIKVDALGNLLWAKSYGAAGHEFYYDALPTADNGCIISGYSNSFSGAAFESYLLKIDSVGNLLWSKVFNQGNLFFKNCKIDNQRWASTGSINTTTPSGHFGGIIQLDTAGNITSSNLIRNNGSILDILRTYDGGFVVPTGISLLDTACVIKTDSLGFNNCSDNYSPSITSTSVNTSVTNITPLVFSGVFNSMPVTQTVSSISPNIVICRVTGITEIDNDFNFSIYVSESGNVVIKPNHIIHHGSVKIYSLTGQLIKAEILLDTQQKEINLSAFAGGVYFVQINTGKTVLCKKVLLQY
jgi:hypothetical protein